MDGILRALTGLRTPCTEFTCPGAPPLEMSRFYLEARDPGGRGCASQCPPSDRLRLPYSPLMYRRRAICYLPSDYTLDCRPFTESTCLPKYPKSAPTSTLQPLQLNSAPNLPTQATSSLSCSSSARTSLRKPLPNSPAAYSVP